jgi:hypothetical protein
MRWTGLQILDNLQEVLETTPQPIELPHHQDVSCPTGPQGIGQLWTGGTGARGVFFVDIETPSLAEGILLQVQRLILGGDPRIANLCHQRSLSWCCA